MARQLSRTEFLHVSVGFVAAGFVLEACGSDGTTAPVSMCKTDGAKDGGIDDPTHHLVVPGVDITAGVSKTYSIKGTQTHDHKVTLEAADFASLGSDATVRVRSTTNLGHSHTFAVVCA